MNNANFHKYAHSVYKGGNYHSLCECGWSKEIGATQSASWDAWHVHSLEEETEAEHAIKTQWTDEDGLEYILCTCAWRKKIKRNQSAESVFQGHLGTMKQQRRQNRNSFTKTPYESRYSNVKKAFGYSKVTTAEEVNAIAIEVLGGTYYAFVREEEALSV